MEKVRGDDAQLAAMGHRAELKRNFSMLYASLYRSYGNAVIADDSRSMLGLAFAILNVRAYLHASRDRMVADNRSHGQPCQQVYH